MKKIVFISLFLQGLIMSAVSQATLVDRGGGMVYDDELDVTWLQDANYAKTSGYDADGLMNWKAAKVWAGQLVYGGFDDWRLPIVSPVNGSSFNYRLEYDGSSDRSYNITSGNSELAFMFYVNLKNKSSYDVLGNATPCPDSDCLVKPGLFKNFKSSIYWSGIGYKPITSVAWAFDNHLSRQNGVNKKVEAYAWAVRSGDVKGGKKKAKDVVNIQNVVATINQVLKNEQRSGGTGNDCNSDSKVNIQDVVCVINKVLKVP